MFLERNPKTITVGPTGSSLIEPCPTEFDYAIHIQVATCIIDSIFMVIFILDAMHLSSYLHPDNLYVYRRNKKWATTKLLDCVLSCIRSDMA